MADNEDLTRKIDQSDLVMPKLRISQAMSKVNAQFSETRGKSGVGMGAWYNTNDSKDLGMSSTSCRSTCRSLEACSSWARVWCVARSI
jgi:hypothetical protein